ncbi:MAG: HIT domain-containing protein [Acidimicrobiaceae bacterium]|nr:HIT domain-containing protein [Acidimicrobiaceae bacterium]
MERIWAGWRGAYLSGELSRGKLEPECVLCEIAAVAAEGDIQCRDDELLVVYRGESAVVALNLYPYTSGHLMIVPKTHTSEIDLLSAESRFELLELANRAVKALRVSHGAAGFNIGMNLGRPSGAAIVDHVHLHVVPRYIGDANFMTATADVRVIPEALSDTLGKIRKVWT